MEKYFLEKSIRSIYQQNLRDNIANLGEFFTGIAYPLTAPGEYQYLKYHRLAESNETLFELSTRVNALFFHIPKSAGMSISQSIFGTQVGHYRYRDIALIFPSECLKRIFKFSIVRHPVTRLASGYNFLKKGGLTREDQNWAIKYISPFGSFEDFVINGLGKNQNRYLRYLHFRPQHTFITDLKGEIALDYIGKYENLENDYIFISKSIGIESTLDRINVTNHNNKNKPLDNLSQEALNIISLIYKKDYEILSY